MDINELIAQLQELADAGVERVVGATQPSYPLEAPVKGVAYDDESEAAYIVLGNETGYASKDLWNLV